MQSSRELAAQINKAIREKVRWEDLEKLLMEHRRAKIRERAKGGDDAGSK